MDSEVNFFNRNSRCLFQDYPWINLWDQVFQRNGRYAICEENGAIHAIFPFYHKKNADHRLPFLQWTELCLMATGTLISTDYADFPALKESKAEWEGMFVRFIQDLPGWDVLRFIDVLEDSNAYTLFEAFKVRGFSTLILEREHCPYFDMDFTDVDAFIRTKPRRYRENLMRRIRNINKQCDIRYESEVTKGNCDYLFDNLVRLHNLRKESKGITGKFGEASYEQFHRSAFRHYATTGELIVPRLMDGDKIIAITYAYIDKGTYYGYQTGMDPAYRIFSPGEVLTYYIVDDLKKRGVHRFDFLRGDEKYKYNWSTNEFVMKDLLAFRNTPKGLLMFGYMKTMKKLKESEFVGRARKYFRHGKQNTYATKEKTGETGDN